VGLSRPQRFPPCREWFETDRGVRETLPGDAADRAMRLVGCKPAVDRAVDDWWFVAYPVEVDRAEGTDLKLAAYRDGDLAWTHRVERVGRTAHFTANYRSSFVAPLPPRHVCVGSLWSGETQVECLDLSTGAPRWKGALSFWSGIAPRAHRDSLVLADVSGLTRRYPYTGEEMQRRDFEELGGRSAFYAASDRRLFFAPRPSGPPQLTAYRFEDFDADWRLELPAHPPSGYRAEVFPEASVVLVKLQGTVWAIDTERGRPRWGVEVGDGRPAAARIGGRIYLLVQRDQGSNVLYAFDPREGTLIWYTSIPTGYLHLEARAGELFVRSVEAVRRVDLPESGEVGR
ncbi:MAG: PLuB system PQQ-binding repeat protein, partial [Bradymonadaceae bacterium]